MQPAREAPNPTPQAVEYLRPQEMATFLRRNWLKPALGAALLAAITLGWVLLSGPTYEASATLMVAPARFSSDLKPAALSVLGYQRLLESDEIRAEMRTRLLETGVLAEGDKLDLRSRIFTARRADELPLAPILEAVARSKEPDKAAAIANEWSRAFVDAANRLRGDTVAPTLAVVEKLYETERTELQGLTQLHIEEAARFAERIDEADNRWDRLQREKETTWDRKIADLEAEAVDNLEAYQAETRSMIENYAAQWQDEVAANVEIAAAGEEPGKLPQALHERLLQIVSLRTRLAQTARVLSLENSGSGDSLLKLALLLDSGQEGGPSDWASQSLMTEEPNPVHSELVLRLSEVETGVEDLSTDEQQSLQRLIHGLEQRQQQRSAGLDKLIARQTLAVHEARRQKAFVLRELQRDRQRELDRLRRERDQRLAQLDLEIKFQRGAFEVLAENFNQARLARAEEEVRDVRVAAAAVPPDLPLPRNTVPKLIVALVVGGLAGLLLAFAAPRRPSPAG